MALTGEKPHPCHITLVPIAHCPQRPGLPSLSLAEPPVGLLLTLLPDLSRVRLPASRGDRKWFGDGRKRDNAESAGI
jgi:hypothetical protein